MVSTSRRALLSGLVGGAASLSGCGSLSTATGSHDSSDNPTGVASDPTYRRLRRESGGPIVWEGDQRPTEPLADGAWETAGKRFLVVDDEDVAGALSFADVPDVDEGRRLVTETAFDESTVLVDQQSVRQCYRLQLCSASWGPNSVDFQYTWVPRPYGERCRADATATVTHLVRVDAAIDADAISTYGSGTSSGGCDRGVRGRLDLASKEGTP